jgi:hypothetical protein
MSLIFLFYKQGHHCQLPGSQLLPYDGHPALQVMIQMFCIAILRPLRLTPPLAKNCSSNTWTSATAVLLRCPFFALPITFSTGSPPPPVEAAGKTEAATEPTLEVFISVARKLLPQRPFRGEALAGEHWRPRSWKSYLPSIRPWRDPARGHPVLMYTNPACLQVLEADPCLYIGYLAGRWRLNRCQGLHKPLKGTVSRDFCFDAGGNLPPVSTTPAANWRLKIEDFFSFATGVKDTSGQP